MRAYDDFGQPVGSKKCEEGKIFIEPQGMCIMAGIGLRTARPSRRWNRCNKHLATQHGIVLQQPAYSQYYLHLGEISSYPPGYKENAGIFCHTNPWIIIAETMVGNGDRAFDYYLRINPSAREAIGDVHRCEPYVYAQMIAGQGRPDARRSQELLAHRHRRLELRRHHPMDSGHPRRDTTACGSPRLSRLPGQASQPRASFVV